MIRSYAWLELRPRTGESDAGGSSFSPFPFVASCRDDHLGQVLRGRGHIRMAG
jgi:hypothetical protein